MPAKSYCDITDGVICNCHSTYCFVTMDPSDQDMIQTVKSLSHYNHWPDYVLKQAPTYKVIYVMRYVCTWWLWKILKNDNNSNNNYYDYCYNNYQILDTQAYLSAFLLGNSGIILEEHKLKLPFIKYSNFSHISRRCITAFVIQRHSESQEVGLDEGDSNGMYLPLIFLRH